MLRRLIMPNHLRPVLIEFDSYVSLVKDSCVTSIMHALTSFQTFAGDEASHAQQVAEGKSLLYKTINDMMGLDATLDGVHSALDKTRINFEAEVNIVSTFYLTVTEKPSPVRHPFRHVYCQQLKTSGQNLRD